MTTRKEALTMLRDKVKAGKWPQNLAWKIFGIGVTGRVDRAYRGSLDAAKALRIALGLPVPEKMHSDARLELLDTLEALIAQEPDT